jgi:arsenite-transporting ATPase
MVGGKGGVGKTTCAAAMALYFANQGITTLVLSSDPTPSLSDIFETPLGGKETSVPGVPNLAALEISSELVLEKWQERFGPEIYEIVSSFTDLGYDFVLEYIGSAPGIEEEYMLYYILELVRENRYEMVVWDTAPAGHTLRLLRLPELFLKHLEGATRFYLNLYGYLEKAKDTVTMKRGKRPLLDIIAGWQALSSEISTFIRDSRQTAYVIVTIPEALGVKQTERIIADLDADGLSVRYLVVNNVINKADCEFHRTRRAMQAPYIDFLTETYSQCLDIILLPMEAREIKGIDAIANISRVLFAS